MRIDQRDLENFYYVVTTNSFTAAAAALGVSKGYISKSIAKLEQELQLKLFNRSTRQLLLTTAGERLFATVADMQQQLQSGLDNLQQLTGEPIGELKISAPPALSECLLAPMLTKFQQKYPQVTIDISLQSKVVDVIAGGYDLVFRGAKLDESNLIARKIFAIKNVLVASKDFVQQYGLPAKVEELNDFHVLAYKSSGKIIWQFKQQNKVVNLNVEPKFVTNLSTMLKAMVISGCGITSLPDFTVTEEIKQNKLVYVLPEWEQVQQTLYVLYPSREYMPLKTKCMLDFISGYRWGL